MPTFPNPAGGSMTVANEAEARAKGWTPSMGSFGVNSYGDSTPTNPNTTPTTPVPNPGLTKIDPNDMAKLQNFFGQTSGFSREELAEKKRQFDEQIAYYERQWQREGLPKLQIEQQKANLEVERFRSTTGLDYLKFASTLGGPADVFQQSDFYRGAQQRGDVPLFLKSLQDNTQMPAFTGGGGVPATPLTAAGIASRLTGGGTSTPGGYNTDDALSTIGSIFKRGATGLAPNSLEQLNPSELGILQSGAKKLGYSWEDLIKSYGASRIGQMAATPV